MSLENITFKPVSHEDIPAMVALMNSYYTKKIQEGYFYWQYFDKQFPAVSMGAFDNGQLVGITGIRKRALESGITGGFAMDAIVAPEWRGTLLAQHIGERALSYYEDVDFICALPNQHWKNFCVKRFGWKSISRVNSMVLKRSSFHEITDNARQKDAFHADGKILERFKYDEDIRSWRFDQHPGYKYYYSRLATGEFAVTKIFEDTVTETRFGDIVDIQCNLYNTQRLKVLLDKACRHLFEQGAESITTWALPHTPLRPVVESLGFVELKQERYFCVKVLRPAYEHLYDPGSWHLVEADAEIY